MTPQIEVKNLTKRFKDVVAINDISFSIQKGEIVGLLGPNGAGKTTTMHTLLGLITPTAGTINMLGKEFKSNREDILGRINFSSAYIQFMSQLTIWENLYVFARLYNISDARKKISSLLELMEISHMKKTLFGKLSSGQKTRVILAKTLLNDPEILLLDEPTASLDPDIADKVLSTLKNIHTEKNVTILYTSHNMAEIEELCERVIFLHKGNIIHRGTPQELTRIIPDYTLYITTTNSSEDIEAFKKKFSDYTIKEPTAGHLQIQTHEKQLPELLQKVMKENLHLTNIDIKKPDLEDVFIKFSRETKVETT
ncbi:MAG: ABC transporter ATP-binding protein [Candidatus Jacksonbacteria bacterium]|jgi:ABC-2 type transport system ATP-binding protein|nr:ABC transporter ATP-binding protein [Candidatus Jacksonbacteria bacterium]